MKHVIALLVVIAGCGSVSNAGSDGAAGSGSQAGAGGGTSGAASGGGIGGAAGTMGGNGAAGTMGGDGAAGTSACASGQNTRQDCRDNGIVLFPGAYLCRDDGFANDPTWGTCGADGKITGTEYSGLACPFDVAAEYDSTVTSCPEAVGWRASPGSVAWCSWRDTADTIYCCNARTVRKIARCK